MQITAAIISTIQITGINLIDTLQIFIDTHFVMEFT